MQGSSKERIRMISNGSGNNWNITNTISNNNLLNQNPSIKNISSKNIQPINNQTTSVSPNQKFQTTSTKNVTGMNLSSPILSEPRRSVYTNSQLQM